MKTVVGRALGATLALILAGSLLVPATAGAAAIATPRLHAPAAVLWHPGSLGTITVHRGTRQYRSAWFVIARPLRDIHLTAYLSPAASGSVIRFVPGTATYFPRLDRGSMIPVQFYVAASREARIGVVPADLHVDALVGGPHDVARVGNDLDFQVDVDAAAGHPVPPPRIGRVIYWSAPHNNLGTLTIQRGQALAETVTFTSTANLTNVQLKESLGLYARTHGLSIANVTPAVLPTLAANTPVNVSFSIVAAPDATAGFYSAALHVDGQLPGGAYTVLPHGLGFAIRVVDYIPVISWTPPHSVPIALTQGQSVTETASFVSSVALSSASLTPSLSHVALQNGIAVTVAAIPASVAAGTSVPVQYTVTAGAGAVPGTYAAIIYVSGSQNGGPVMGLHYGLHLLIMVHRAVMPVPHITWSGGSYVTFPALANGSTINETATFTTNVALTNARLVMNVTERVAGVKITLAPLAGSAIAANTPVQITLTIDASSLPATRLGGFYKGNVYVIGQAVGANEPMTLHYGLHFVGAID